MDKSSVITLLFHSDAPNIFIFCVNKLHKIIMSIRQEIIAIILRTFYRINYMDCYI